jgi:hypothetical protein
MVLKVEEMVDLVRECKEISIYRKVKSYLSWLANKVEVL